MIDKGLRNFIEQQCSGKEPSELIMEAIEAKIAQTGSDGEETLAFVEECVKGPTLEEKAAEAKRVAEKEADRLARIKEAEAKAQSDALNAERAAERAKAAMADAELARQRAEEMKARERAAKDARIEARAKKRTYFFVGAAVVAVIIFSVFVYVWLRTGRNAIDVAKEAAYNAVNTEKIKDMEVDTSDLPNEDPSVVIDPNGDVKQQLGNYYEIVTEFANGLYRIKSGKLVGIADSKGKIIQKPKFTRIASRNEKGLIKVYNGNKEGYLNIRGILVVPPVYSNIGEESEGLIPVEQNGKHGFLNATTLQEVTPCLYDYVYAKKDNLYKVKIGNKTGYLNADGSVNQAPK